MDLPTLSYGVGWVPNISGDVTKRDHLANKIQDKSIKVGDKQLFLFMDGNNVDVRDGCGQSYVSIVPFDCKGLCLINVKKESPRIDDSSPEGLMFKFFVLEIWAEFRKLVDSCSGICSCSAMDVFVADSMDRYDAIARRFVFSLENIADSSTYAKMSYENQDLVRKHVLLDEVATRSNILYFQRFIEFYSNDVINLKDYESQIRCRKDKSAIISHYNTESRSIGQVEEVKELIELSNTVVGSIGTYTESINELSRSLVDSADRSKVFTYVSIGIAIVAVFVAIALDYL